VQPLRIQNLTAWCCLLAVGLFWLSDLEQHVMLRLTPIQCSLIAIIQALSSPLSLDRNEANTILLHMSHTHPDPLSQDFLCKGQSILPCRVDLAPPWQYFPALAGAIDLAHPAITATQL
jgi:hypothetical protein